ncbi:hypothetical protein BC833DRAFT_570825, partial [Globomyces pollinis-pini]
EDKFILAGPVQRNLFDGAAGANHVIGVQCINGIWRYHCDIAHSAFCELQQDSPTSLAPEFLKGLETVQVCLRIVGSFEDIDPCKWYTRIYHLFQNETINNSAKIPENWKSQSAVLFGDQLLAKDRDWSAGSFTVISKQNRWSLVKWHAMDCRHALWVPNFRIELQKRLQQ